LPTPDQGTWRAKIYLKREDLNHTGAHKINNAMGQILWPSAWARRASSPRPARASTVWHRHGERDVRDEKCVIYMGAVDYERQMLHVVSHEDAGAEVVPVHAGQKTLRKPSTKPCATGSRTSAARITSSARPMARIRYPVMVRNFQRIIGDEARAQILEKEKRLPDMLIARVGGGSNAIGLCLSVPR